MTALESLLYFPFQSDLISAHFLLSR